MTLILGHKDGGDRDTAPDIHLFAGGGCTHFTPRVGYVTDP